MGGKGSSSSLARPKNAKLNSFASLLQHDLIVIIWHSLARRACVAGPCKRESTVVGSRTSCWNGQRCDVSRSSGSLFSLRMPCSSVPSSDAEFGKYALQDRFMLIWLFRGMLWLFLFLLTPVIVIWYNVVLVCTSKNSHVDHYAWQLLVVLVLVGRTCLRNSLRVEKKEAFASFLLSCHVLRFASSYQYYLARRRIPKLGPL
jgi:hypothetical protein